jgi:hypothetical protein
MSTEENLIQEASINLTLLTTCLPEIRQRLGQDWPAFAYEMRAQAMLFVNPTDEVALDEAVNQLLGLFLDGGTVEEIITRPDAMKRRPDPIADDVSLQTIANRFYLFCQKADELIEKGALEELSEQAEVVQQTQPEVADREEQPKKK